MRLFGGGGGGGGGGRQVEQQNMQVVVSLRYVLLFWVVLTPLNRSSSLSAMFDYIRVPPKNPINVRAPSLGPRLSLFSEVSYCPLL